MAKRSKPVILFEAGDERKSSKNILVVRSGEKAVLHSTGWGCGDECDDILVYRFLHYASNTCGDKASYIYKWTKDISVSPTQTAEVPMIRLTKNNPNDTILDKGQYLLVRKCGAEDVNVVASYQPL